MSAFSLFKVERLLKMLLKSIVKRKNGHLLATFYYAEEYNSIERGSNSKFYKIFMYSSVRLLLH